MMEQTELSAAVEATSHLVAGRSVAWHTTGISPGNQTLCQQVAGMIAALPDRHANPIGIAARKAMVNRLEAATPGQLDFPGFLGIPTHPSPFDTFYGGSWKRAPYCDDVPAASSTDGGFWSNWSEAATADAMYRQEVDTWNNINSGAVGGDLSTYNATFFGDRTTPHAMPLYSYVLQHGFDEFSTWLGQVQKPAAKQLYAATLQGPYWQQDILGKLGNPIGRNPEDPVFVDFAWYLYHHFVKLSALGATLAEVNSVAVSLPGSIMASNLVPLVGATNWVAYTAWAQKPGTTNYTVDGGDLIVDAGSGFRYSRSVTNGCRGGASASCSSSEISASSSWIGHSRYAVRGYGGSCFASGTRVRMADGSLKNIERVLPGDHVAGTGGARTVMFVAQPPRGGRALYSFVGHPFQFTATQPFLHPSHQDAAEPTFVALDRHRLDRSMPTLADLGVTQLEPGMELLAFQENGPPTRVAISETVRDSEGEAEPDELVYDVVVAADDQGHSEYFAGDAQLQLLVASEMPVVEREPYAAIAVLKALSIVAPTLASDTGMPERSDFDAVADRIVKTRLVVPYLVNQALELRRQAVAAVSAESAESLDLVNLHEPVTRTMGYFTAADGSYNWRLGRLFERLIIHFARKISVVIDHGWRSMPLPPVEDDTSNVLAVGVHHVTLSDRSEAASIDIRVELSKPTGVTEQVARGSTARAQTPFAHHSDEELYFPSSIAEVNADTPVPEMIVSCEIAGGMARGYFSLRDLDRVGYRGAPLSLLGADGTIVGRCYVDARLLSDAEVQQEKQLLASWDNAHKVALANSLGEVIGQVLVRAFAESDAIANEAKGELVAL
jgi:hypothetical protein